MSGGRNLYRNQKGTVVHRADCRVRGSKVKWDWPDTTEGFGWVGDRPASDEYGGYPLDWVRACKVCRPLLLGITLGQLRGLIRNGAIPTKKIGGRLYARRSDLTTYADQPSTAKQPPTMPRITHPSRLAPRGGLRPAA